MAVRADAARMGQRLGDQVTYQGQEDESSPAQTEAAPLCADGLPGFDQAAIGPLPGGGEEHPIPCARSSPSSLAESAVSLRAGSPPRVSSRWPWSFQSLKSRSLCQRKRLSVAICSLGAGSGGTGVSRPIPSASANAAAGGTRPWRAAASRMPWRLRAAVAAGPAAAGGAGGAGRAPRGRAAPPPPRTPPAPRGGGGGAPGQPTGCVRGPPPP